MGERGPQPIYRKRKQFSFDITYILLMDELNNTGEITSLADLFRAATQCVIEALENLTEKKFTGDIVKKAFANFDMAWKKSADKEPSDLTEKNVMVPKQGAVTVEQELKLKELKSSGIIKDEAVIVRAGVYAFFEIRNIYLKTKKMPDAAKIKSVIERNLAEVVKR